MFLLKSKLFFKKSYFYSGGGTVPLKKISHHAVQMEASIPPASFPPLCFEKISR